MESGKSNEGHSAVGSSFWRFVATGAIGFGLSSLCVFATVAFAEGWMYTNLGLGGAYFAWTVLFIVLGGSALHPLVRGEHRGWRFYGLFGLAFFAYSLGWVTAYFLQKNLIGEWIGSLAGSILMALVLAMGFRALPSLPRLIAVLFLTNSAGYFLGSMVNNALGKQAGMISWGGIYGLFQGAGLGAVLYLAHRILERPGSDG
jgi:hypothetical protein